MGAQELKKSWKEGCWSAGSNHSFAKILDICISMNHKTFARMQRDFIKSKFEGLFYMSEQSFTPRAFYYNRSSYAFLSWYTDISLYTSKMHNSLSLSITLSTVFQIDCHLNIHEKKKNNKKTRSSTQAVLKPITKVTPLHKYIISMTNY